MANSLLCAAIFSLLVYEGSTVRGNVPYAHLYRQSYFKEYVSTIQTSQSNLEGTPLEGNVTSAKVNGVWAFFRFPKFNQDKDPLLSYILWGDIAQTGHLGSLANHVSSIRLLGGVKDPVSNLRIYDGTYFTGAEKIFFKDAPSIHYLHTSLLLKNCKPWTIYSEINYKGLSLCLYPNNNEEYCSPWFFFDEKDYKLPNIRSIRRGCHSENRLIQS